MEHFFINIHEGEKAPNSNLSFFIFKNRFEGLPLGKHCADLRPQAMMRLGHKNAEEQSKATLSFSTTQVQTH